MHCVKPWIERELHYLIEHPIEDPDFFITINENEIHPELAKWIRCITTDEIITYKKEEGRHFLINDEKVFEIKLDHYLQSDGDGIHFLVKEYEIEEGEEFTLKKEAMSQEEYNKHLQYTYDEEFVYPEICEKCGHYMGCSRHHYEKRDGAWERIRCSNHACKNVKIKDRLLEIIRMNNEKGIIKDYKNHLAECGQYLKFESQLLDPKIPIDEEDEFFDYCRECGYQGNPGVYGIIRHMKNNGEWETRETRCCPICLGKSYFSFKNKVLPVDTKNPIETE